MNPLAAFQVLVLTMAAAMAVEALKSSDTRSRLIFWVLFAALGALGIATNLIAAAWPVASRAMAWVGSSPITFFFVFLAWVIFLQKPWRKIKSAGFDLATLQSDAEREEVRKLGVSVGEVVGLIQKQEIALAALDEKLTVVNAAYAGEVTGLKAAVEELKSEYIAHHSLNADALRQQFDNLYMALEAIFDRERMRNLEAQMSMTATRLVVVEDAPPFDDNTWGRWQSDEIRWSDDLARWCERAAKYLPGVSKEIYDIPPNAYRVGQWPSDVLFGGDSIKVHDYKTFMLKKQRFDDIRGHIARRVSLAAFDRQAAQMRAGGPA